MRDTVRRLVCASLLDGHEHSDEIAGAEIGVLVRGVEDTGTYVAVWITGSVPDNFVAIALDLVPGCDRDGWYPEFAMPGRALRPGEQIYSNMMDPQAAAQLLGENS